MSKQEPTTKRVAAHGAFRTLGTRLSDGVHGFSYPVSGRSVIADVQLIVAVVSSAATYETGVVPEHLCVVTGVCIKSEMCNFNNVTGFVHCFS